ncbi:hypothetical protein [Clostridium cellulovorans]|uniref:DUF2007 domain-containing protein n=1 Tax=Clostridium cellulovorans (strain ATCC 35296 / DSM 3052 / OCM 3 / 743B) TaxID=573061 RepID=D9SM07_CLOC7|nr:hypothetical protein [Clostridium cellulovorans]ADL51738.1 hypothetical protein Clocel_1994 [Clostridium cellulovorans 743B]
MITRWNRKEIYIGYSSEKLKEVIDKLSESEIKYKYKIIEYSSAYLFSSRSVRTGIFGENLDYLNTYYVFVNRKDYDKACEALSRE